MESSPYKYWKRNLVTMFFVQMVFQVGFNIFLPFLPLYISTDLGVGNMTQASIWAGLVLAIPGLTSAIFSPIWGALGDKTGRKPMVLRACIAATVITLMMSMSRNVYDLFLLRIIQGALSGFSGTALGLMGSCTPKEKLGSSLGWLQTSQILGIMIGPVIGGLIADHYSYRAVFLATSALVAICALSVWTMVKEDFTPVQSVKKQGMFQNLAETFHMEGIGALFLVMFLTQFSIRSLEPVIPLFVKEMMAGSAGLNTFAGSALAVAGITQALSVLFIPRAQKAFGYQRLLVFALLLTAIAYFPQGLVQSPGQLIGVRLVIGFFLGGIMPVANALVGSFAPDENKARVFGVTQSAYFLGNFTGPIVGGVVLAFLGTRAMFFVASGLLAINALWAYKALAKRKASVKATAHQA